MELSKKTADESLESTEMEKTKLCRMRILVEKEDPTSKEEDDLTFRRFLRARDLDVEKASAMFLKYLKWRRSFVPNGSISPSQIRHDIEQNKVFLQGSDKKGRPIAVVFGARHFQHKGGVEEFKRFLVFTFQKIFARIPPGEEKFVVIVDIKGWGYSNSDFRGYLAAISFVQDYYPERLGKVFMVHAPYIFMTAWKTIYPFIDCKTRKKIAFVEKKSLKSSLLEEIDESQLPEIFGGKQPLVPIHEA